MRSELHIKHNILHNICYTELVYGRINKKLGTDFSKAEIESMIYATLKETDEKDFSKQGKNYYVSNRTHRIKITINSNTYRVITVDRFARPLELN
ncbi:MAG TPA: DUF3781 domain-containing protein [Candidatus Saccharimonadales bacterium]